ncbi:MAG: hypothetical protein Q9187_009299, partial [Circinaria calcarea]
MQNKDGDTSLHLLCTVRKGPSLAIAVKSLLNHGAAVNVGNKAGYTCIKILFRNWAKLIADGHQHAFVGKALVEVVHHSEVSEVLELQYKEGSLWSLALSDHNQQLIDSMLALIENNDSEASNTARFNMIKEACLEGCDCAVFTRLVKDSKEIFEDFDHGEKRTLHLASQAGHSDLVKILLNLGCDIDSPVLKTKMTALMLAAQSGRVAVISVLLEAGASQDVVDSNGWTALHHACYNGHLEIIRILDHSCLDRMKQVATLDLEHVQYQDVTCLHLAAYMGHFNVARYLLKNTTFGGINATTKENWTPLHLASGCGHFDMVSLLLEKRANCTITEVTCGGTVLHWACFNGHQQIVRLLLKQGADPYQLDREGRSAEVLAFQNQYMDIVGLFQDYAPEN